MENANILALRQIEAAAADTANKLRAEILLKEQQAWVHEFRQTINEILYLGAPELDGGPELSNAERIRRITRLAHKIDLLLPPNDDLFNKGLPKQAELVLCITHFADFLKRDVPDSDRLQYASEITRLTRVILTHKVREVEFSLPSVNIERPT